MLSFFKNIFVKDAPITLVNGVNPLDVIIRRNARSKTIKIKINIKNKVELILPKYADISRAHKFLIEKESWIRERITKHTASIEKQNISILGENYELILDDRDIDIPIKIKANKIFISHVVNPSKIPSILEIYLKKIAKNEIEIHCIKICELLDVKYNKISIKDTVTRWGSCSIDKNLSFSWRLVLAPRNVMEYVVVHEVCHLIEMNHSSKFWNLVYKVCPDYFEAKIWLKKNGKKLHQYI